MKYVFLFFILFSLGCSDDELTATELSGVNLIGKWQLEATKISPGGPVDWSNVDNGTILEFKPNSFLEQSNSENNGTGIYRVEENKISITFSGTNNFTGLIKDGKIIIGFVGCIEECSFRYRRIN
jgi:hypothetical protein